MRPALVGMTLWLGAFAALGSEPARAHAFAPSLLEMRQVAEQTFAVRWKQPTAQPRGAALRPVLPESCTAVDTPDVATEGTGTVVTWTVDCADGLVGRSLRVDGIAGSQADVLLRLELADGRTIRHVLTPDRSSFVVPEAESLWDVGLGYGRLGVEHILLGFDHLLFVFGLLLLVRGGRRLLVTITAFTAGHSVTLALAALGVVRVPQQPVEMLIALSIYFLAVEISRRQAGGVQTLVERAPWLVPGGFGLLHGLGFAGALTEIGLPQADVPAALFAFNVGIELGQILFVGAVLLLVAAAKPLLAGRATETWPRRLTAASVAASVYVVGVPAVYWFLERAWGVFVA